MTYEHGVAASRRRFLSGVTGFGLTAGGLMSAGNARAAAECPAPDSSFLAQIGRAMSLAEIRFVDLAVSEKPDFKMAETTVRELLLKPLEEAGRYDLRLLVRHDQIALTTMMRSYDVSATRFDEKATKPPEAVKIKAEEHCWEVFLSILLDTFEIDMKARGAFWAALKDQKLDRVAEQIGRAARRKDWPRTTLLLRKFLTRLSGRKMLALLEDKIGKEAVRKMLRTFASRFVPWLGWLVMAGALATSLFNNRSRLEKCN